MTRDEVKLILNSYKDQQSKIRMLKSTYDFWLEEIGNVSANDYGAVKVKSAAYHSSPEERYVICCENAKERYDRALIIMEEIAQKIEKLCECLSERERNFIADLYMSNKEVYQIQCEYDLTYDAYCSFKRRIFAKIQAHN